MMDLKFPKHSLKVFLHCVFTLGWVDILYCMEGLYMIRDIKLVSLCSECYSLLVLKPLKYVYPSMGFNTEFTMMMFYLLTTLKP